MPTQAERNQFRRLIGDYGRNLIDDDSIDAYLDDAAAELTADFASPVVDFDILVKQFHPEVVVFAAINWWWNRASHLADQSSKTVGQSSTNTSEKWDRAMAMIKELEARFQLIQTLGTDITFGNISRFSKSTLTRLGGRSEEQTMNET